MRTPRLLLRRPHPADAEALRAALEASLSELRRWMFWAQDIGTLEQTRERLQAAAEKFDRREELRLHVWSADGQTFLGSSGYHALDWRVPKAEIGYWIATPHTGQGYALEVAQSLTTFGLDVLALRRLEIRCDSRNERSARIPRQLGYSFDARLVNDSVAPDAPGELRDTLIFSRVR